ncbi:MAG: DUF5602 domain-containing protein [Calothrix sp. MO_192.B10]|nr:DUF5602 domain-containing protein [Calothrix sp. MO_192.B10]
MIIGKKLLLAVIVSVLITWGIVDTAQAEQIYGESKPLGKGNAITWVKLDDSGHPLDIGVSFSKEALSGLPTESDKTGNYPLRLMMMDGSGNPTFEYELPLPTEVSVTPFTHVGINWNPKGHTPDGIFSFPHFDIHFYLMDCQKRYAIKATDHDFLDKAYKAPPEEFVAPGYFPAPMSAEPRMGVHWVDATASEFHGETFTKTMIYGFYDGEIVFFEPMISRDFLLNKPNKTFPIKQTAAYPQDGYYPTAYSINYDANHEEYTVSLNGLTFRPATVASVP